MKKLLLLSCFLFTGVVVALAQRPISGNVADVSGEPLIGANVRVSGTTVGTVTDYNGDFKMTLPQEGTDLIVSYTGFVTKTVSVRIGDMFKITLEEDVQKLSEVVVVGYGTVERRDLTGSVTSINNKGIENLVGPSFESQLAGRAAGVMVTTPSGVLGEAPIVRIRGVNSITSGAGPLYVIDGVPVVTNDRSGIQGSNPLANINPQDIQSFEVLKDGSATAIFGSRASNGVILITTKRGAEGKAKVSYNVTAGFSSAANRFDLLNGEQFVEIANEKRRNAGATELAVYDGTNTDWQDHVLVNGFSQQHNLSIAGGSQSTKYFFSLGFSDQGGIIRSNDMKRYSFRANLDHNVSSRIRVGTSLSYTHTHLNGLNNGENSLSGATYSMTRMLPNVGIYDDSNTAYDGYNVSDAQNSLGIGSNAATVDNNIPNIAFVLANNIYRTRVHRMLGSAYGEIDILKNLTARTQIGVDASLPDDFLLWNTRHGDGKNRGGYIYHNYAPAYRWNWQNTLNYQKVIANDHSLNVTAGLEYQKTTLSNFTSTAQGFSDEYYTLNNLISGSFGDEQFAGGGFSEIGFDSYFARLNYGYKGKYLASFSIRNDGISSLALDNRRGTFYGGSLGWRLSDENFFNVESISDLKFRVSYAEVGNTEIGSYPYAGGFAPVLYGSSPGTAFSRVDNSNLQWETSKKLNIGMDMTISGVSVTLDLFQNNIDNMVLDAPVPLSLGIPNSQISQNVGSMVNKGVELALGFDILKSGDFKWAMDFNITLMSNEVLSLVNDISGGTTGVVFTNTVEGRSISELYGYRWAGVNAANGNPMYYSENGGIVQYNLAPGNTGWRLYDSMDPSNVSSTTIGPSADFLGRTLPTYMGGWSNQFSYKGFDLEIFTRFSGGNYIMNESMRGQLGQGFSNNNALILERWTESGQQTDVPKLYSGSDASVYQTGSSNSRFVEKGDFVRIQNVVLGYSLPSDVVNRAFKGNISGLRLFAQVQNLATFTQYTGLDPELNRFSNQTRYGVDYNVTPLARTWSFGLNVDF